MDMERLLLEELTDDEDILELLDIVEVRVIRTFRPRPNNFEIWNEKEFLDRFRLSKQTVRVILNEISAEISNKTMRNHALLPEDALFVTLRFLATGSFLQVVGDLQGVHKSTVSKVIHKVLRTVAGLARQYIKMPAAQAERNAIAQEFYNIARFPRCVGAVDCTLVKIQSPGGVNAEIYRSRKTFFAFNVQAICSANLKIMNIVCRWPGSTHDSTIFGNSTVRALFEQGYFGDSVLVGDSGYGIKPYLITPLENPILDAEHVFNEAQIRTRNPIERTFGVYKRRFPILALGIRLNVRKVEAIVVSTAILQNIATDMNDPVPQVNAELEAEINFQEFVDEEYRGHNVRGGVENIARESLIRYFGNLANV